MVFRLSPLGIQWDIICDMQRYKGLTKVMILRLLAASEYKLLKVIVFRQRISTCLSNSSRPYVREVRTMPGVPGAEVKAALDCLGNIIVSIGSEVSAWLVVTAYSLLATSSFPFLVASLARASATWEEVLSCVTWPSGTTTISETSGTSCEGLLSTDVYALIFL